MAALFKRQLLLIIRPSQPDHLLQQFGEVVDYVNDADTPSIVINYKTRKEAELAMLKGKNFQVSYLHESNRRIYS